MAFNLYFSITFVPMTITYQELDTFLDNFGLLEEFHDNYQDSVVMKPAARRFSFEEFIETVEPSEIIAGAFNWADVVRGKSDIWPVVDSMWQEYLQMKRDGINFYDELERSLGA